MLTPIFTEKSLKLARTGMYSFWTERTATKSSIKAEVAKVFKVHVTKIKTLVSASEIKRNTRGMKLKTMPAKKAIVMLKEGEKIDIFEETKKK